jgi:hypothetical protein
MSRPIQLGLLLAALLLPASAHAATTVTVKGVPAAGPATYDKSYVTKIGPSSARTVLVLVPGYVGGAGDFLQVGEDLVDRTPGLQVWAVDRRSQALEDTSWFDRFTRGQATAQQVRDYYLGWIENPQQQPRFTPPDPKGMGFVANWGLPTHLGDLRRVILAAKRQGKRVILGGHSLGASTTAIYATWDFNGRPGYKDVDGLVLIDGGSLGSFARIRTAGAARKRIEELREQPFADLFGLGLPWAAGVFLSLGGTYAQEAPTAPSPFRDDPLLPSYFKPPVPVTNRAQLGYALDETTSPDSLSLLHVRAGGLADSGDPRDWVDGEVTPIERLTTFAASSPVNGAEWWFPDRLRLDVDGANELRRTKVAKALKLRPWHLRDVDVPLYAFQTDLSEGRVLRGARRYIQRSDVPRRRSKLVNRASTTSHLDPLTAAPATNDFLKTVSPWLRRLARGRAGR